MTWYQLYSTVRTMGQCFFAACNGKLQDSATYLCQVDFTWWKSSIWSYSVSMWSTLLTTSTARLEERPRRDVQRTHLILYNIRFSHKLFPTVKTNCEFPGPSKVSGGYVSSVRASGQVVRKNLVLLLICNHESLENLTSNLIFTAHLLPHRDIKLWSDVFFIVIPVLSLINLV